jgi:hypothetical protein
LGHEHVRCETCSRHVDGSLENALLFFAFLNQEGFAPNYGEGRELYLRERLFNRIAVFVPGSAFQLETEAVAAFVELGNLCLKLRLPVESLRYIGLDI